MSDGGPEVGYDEVSAAFVGETIQRGNVSLQIIGVRSADQGYYLDVEVERVE